MATLPCGHVVLDHDEIHYCSLIFLEEVLGERRPDDRTTVSVETLGESPLHSQAVGEETTKSQR